MIIAMGTGSPVSYQLRIHRVGNETYLASLFGPNNTSVLEAVAYRRQDTAYDSTGALYYVVAVIFLYGFSIILMIGSLIKKTDADHGVSKYMSDIHKIRRLERRQQKYKTRLAMLNTNKRASVTQATGGERQKPATVKTSIINKWSNVSLWANINLERTASTWSLPSIQDTDTNSPLITAPQSLTQSEPSSPSSIQRTYPFPLSRDSTEVPSDELESVLVEPTIPTCQSSKTSAVPSSSSSKEQGGATFVCAESERDYKIALSQLHMDTLHEEEEEHTTAQ